MGLSRLKVKKEDCLMKECLIYLSTFLFIDTFLQVFYFNTKENYLFQQSKRFVDTWTYSLHKKMKFSIKDFSSKYDQSLIEILNGKLYFLGSDC